MSAIDRPPEEPLAAWMARAALPRERLGEDFVPLAGPEGQERQRMEFWCHHAAADDPTFFRRRLGWDGLDETAARRAIGPVRLKASAQPPPWAVLWQALEEEAYGTPGPEPGPPDEPFPFRPILDPLVAAASRRVQGHPALRQGRATGAALAGLEDGLRRRLLALGWRCLLREFHAFRRPWISPLDELLARSGGAVGSDVYRAFLRAMLAEGGARRFFRAYGVLARLVAESVADWVEACTEGLTRLAEDWDDIVATLAGGRDPGPLVAIQLGAGDPHNHGRSTWLLRFAGGLRAVYKPVPAGMGTAWLGLLAWINARGPALPLRVLKQVGRPEHSWMEFVAARSCRNRRQLRDYHRRCGMLLCLIHHLDGADFHHGNLIADRDQPILVDLETVMSPAILAGEPVPGPPSLRRTSLLPKWVEGNGQRFDIGGFASFQARSEISLVWSHGNTDFMDCGLLPLPVPLGPNLPRRAGKPVLPLDFLADIGQGFALMFRFLLQHRGALLAADSPLGAFADTRARVILRATRTYGNLLHWATVPEAMRDGVRFATLTEGLCQAFRAHGARPPLWGLVAHEQEALQRCEIPYFFISASGLDLCNGAGQATQASAIRRSGLDEARARLRAMTSSALNGLLGQIEAAFRPGPEASGSPQEPGDPGRVTSS
ncbi:MAG: type 2 lanthipeptide synthetase LanM [Holophaga sp.]|nr:type 2 lanthipeptide synthetase LanM [Holophaga sp.]